MCKLSFSRHLRGSYIRWQAKLTAMEKRGHNFAKHLMPNPVWMELLPTAAKCFFVFLVIICCDFAWLDSLSQLKPFADLRARCAALDYYDKFKQIGKQIQVRTCLLPQRAPAMPRGEKSAVVFRQLYDRHRKRGTNVLLKGWQSGQIVFCHYSATGQRIVNFMAGARVNLSFDCCKAKTHKVVVPPRNATPFDPLCFRQSSLPPQRTKFKTSSTPWDFSTTFSFTYDLSKTHHVLISYS